MDASRSASSSSIFNNFLECAFESVKIERQRKGEKGFYTNISELVERESSDLERKRESGDNVLFHLGSFGQKLSLNGT